MSRSFDRGIDMTQVSCLEGSDPLSHQAIADYKSCAINAALAIGLNAIAILPAAREIKHGPLPYRSPP
ncbi:MAG: hypothetical protein U0169_16535 [Polyangiaceae bacterium]